MGNIIDCLFIGHNEMSIDEYINIVSASGKDSNVYRDMKLDYIYCDDEPYSISGIYNKLKYEDNSNNKIMSIGNIFSPAIAYLGTYLDRRGFSFDFINSFRENREELRDKLVKNDIGLVAITTTFYLSINPIIEIIQFVKKYNDKVKIVVGGPFIFSRVRTMNEFQLSAFLRAMRADFYINSSQGEKALVELLHALKNNMPLDNINNILYRAGKKIITTTFKPENNKLEENMVNWDLFSRNLGSYISLRSAISCPFNCSFCNIPEREGKYETASVNALEQELDAIHKIGKVRRINFVDDTFNIPPDRFKNILRMMIRNKYNFKWNSYFRSQHADGEMIELMKESGCEGVFLGVESGSEKILKNMNKNANVDRYIKVIDMLREYDINSYVSLIIGFPGESEETVKETIDFMEQTKPDFYNANAWYFDPHTPIEKHREKYKLVGSGYNWSHQTMDSKTAADILDKLFLDLDCSVAVPEYNFEFPGIFDLKERGLSFNNIKELLSLFNLSIKNRMINPTNINTSKDIIAKIEAIIHKAKI